MKRFFLTLGICLSVFSTRAQQNYDASLIPKALLPYASAVVRNSQESLEIKDLDNVVYHIKKVVTVLNKNGDNQAHIAVYHDKINQIKSIRGAVYNESGALVGKFTERDFDDASVVDDFSIYLDWRVKRFSPSASSYPYTVEYEYETRSKQSLNLDSWEPNDGTGVAVENSSFKVICKPGFAIRFKETNLPSAANISTDATGLKTYTWQASNLKAVRAEPFSPNAENYTASVKLAPQNFIYQGIAGSFTNWADLGKWSYDKLLLNRDEVPAATANHIIEITHNLTDPKQKAKAVYEYMQQKNRYVSVQVGIGGYQPFTASDVDQWSYGDCKALVNYTKALLKVAGIDSWYCVVQAGSAKIGMMPDFASMEQGNHVILCIPFKNDTTWLECTSKKIPFGFLGDFTDDRTVLACTPEGGKLLHTPKYTAQNNLTHRKASLTVTSTGELSGSMTTHFEGVNYDDRYSLIDEPYTEQVKQLKEEYAINNMDIKKLSFKQDKNTLPVTTENLEFAARDYATFDAGKYYFLVNTANRITKTPKDVLNRQNQVYINRGYIDEDEITYTIPAGYHIDRKMLNYEVSKPFGKFSVRMSLQGDQLSYKRVLQLNDGTYSKETYAQLIDFFQTVVDADGYSVVLVKNN